MLSSEISDLSSNISDYKVICKQIHIFFQTPGLFRGHAACLLNRPVRINLIELLLNICTFSGNK